MQAKCAKVTEHDQYLAKYIPNMSELTAPLRSLLKSDVPWTWFPEHDTSLIKLKSVLSSAPVLRFYDTSLPTTLQIDTSKNGLGACLMQQNQPVAYASRAMSSSEINYAQIEKELSAIVYGCERFNIYTYGVEIEVLSDPKSPESIFKKPLFSVPPRLQRMRLRLQKYNLKVGYVPRKFLYIADTLSRAFDQSNVPTDDDMHHDMEHFVHSVIIDLPISDVKLVELRELNCNDPTMQQLHRYAMEGWPQHKRDVNPSIKSFWNVRSDIHVTNGILLKDNRFVIPFAWRTDILQKLHSSHCGIEKTKANARTTVFWPGMNKHIEDIVSCCEKCLKYQSKQTKEPMQTREIPILPWQIVTSGVLEHKNQNYLVVIDYYSKYIEAIRLNGKTSSDIIECLHEIFSRHGYLQTLIACNMPYNSREMRECATQYGINIKTTSPT